MDLRNPIATIAFPKWLALLGVDAAEFSEQHEDDERSSWTYTLGHMDRMQRAVAIYNCLSLGDDELTAQMMLSRLLEEHVDNTSYTLAQILDPDEEVGTQLTLVKEIREVLARDDVMLRRIAFTESLEAAMAHYGAQDRDDVQELIEDDAELAILRQSVLTAMHEISMAQFLKGEAGEAVRPQYSTVIRRWWNLDHMLAASAGLPEGVSLNLIKTPSEHDMFFCFVVRRGGNLYVLNDAPDYAHPLEGQMSRRADRRMADRIAKFWFPYDLADVQMSEDGREAHVRHDRGQRARGLEVAGKINEYSQVLGTIAELEPRELLWTVMMFDRIMDRFWSAAPLPALEMSYTAGQLKPEGQLLLQAASAAGLPVVVGEQAHVAVPDLGVAEVRALHTHADAEAALGETGDYASLRWLEDRYAEHIPEAAMNLVNSGVELVRLGADGQLEVLDEPNHRQLDTDRFFGRDKSLVALNALETTRFGTAQQLRADRSFLARHNYARTIDALAKKEFDARKNEVEQWLAQAYAKRVEFLKTLVPAAANNGLKIQDWVAGEGPEQFEFKGGHAVDFDRSGRFGEQENDRGCSHVLGWVAELKAADTAFMPYLAQGSERPRSFKPLCQVTGTAASYFFAVKPTNSVELAWLLGLPVSDLPDVLQHLSALAPACGNQILDRIDPMLWALSDPWHKLKLGTRMGLSKRGLAQLTKAHPDPVDLSHLAGVNLRMFKPREDATAKPLPAHKKPRATRRG
jgi:hypothetical protein